MTQRELDIYKIIVKEPMISQVDLADRLGVTRSAVSAYISGMIRKGIIKGHGYIVNTEGYPVLIGPGHIDIVSICEDEITRPGLFDSISTRLTYGGAIKNVAQYLARLDRNPRAMFTATADFFGRHFLDDCRLNGIDIDDSLVLSDVSMPIYNEIRRKGGSIIAAADLTDNLANRLTVDFLRSKERTLRGASQIIVPSTLSRDVVEYVTSTCKESQLVYYSIYYHDMMNHTAMLNRFHTVLLSFSAACRLANPKAQEKDYDYTAKGIDEVCRAVAGLGVENAVIQISLLQTCMLTKGKRLLQSIRPREVPTRGAYRFFRDVAAASVAYSLDAGSDRQALLNHQAASKLIAASCDEFVSPYYCNELVESTLQGLNSTFEEGAV